MAIAFDAASASGGKNVTTHPTISHTIGSGSDRMLAAWALQEDPVTQAIPSTYTYNGTALVLSHSRVGDNRAAGYAYYLGEGSLPSGGAYNLILTWNGNSQDSMAGCISLTGVKDQAPEATGANGSGSDQSSGSASITTVTANAWVLIGNLIGGNYTLSYDTSNQRATGNTTGANSEIGDEAFATAGAKSIGWSATSARYWTMVLMAFEPAGAGGGTTYNQAVAGSITGTGAVTTSVTFTKLMTGAITAVGALSRLTKKGLAGAIAATGSLSKKTFVTMVGAITTAGAVSKLTTQAVAGVITATGAVTNSVVFTITNIGAITAAGAIAKQINKGVAGSITATGALIKKTFRLLTGSITAAGAVTPSVVFTQAVAGVITAAGALSTFFIAGVASASNLIRNVIRDIIKAVNKNI